MSQAIRASMAGIVLRYSVKVGDQVTPGQEVAVIESMKMEIPLQAESGGRVKALAAAEGAFVNDGDVIVELE